MTIAAMARTFATGLAMSLAQSVSAAGYEVLNFKDLRGWDQDDHEQALTVFRTTCLDIDDPEWQSLCGLASQQPSARAFFELFFKPVMIGGSDRGLFTGYYEPELNGSRYRGGPYQHPIYKLPPNLPKGGIWYSRSEIENLGLLADKGLAIAYLDDPVEAFFLQIQGSGRVKLAEGGAIRVGYAGKNGHTYRSVGKELVRRGIFSEHQVSASVIKNWVRKNPVDGRTLLQHNPSYVFFREVSEVPSDKGPLGAMNRSITPNRSIAVDPEFTTLGAPVWIEKGGKSPIRRLMIAQDTGSAIKGPQRADIYFGTGDTAGKEAGRIKDPGRMIVLMPIQIAYSLVPEG